MNVEIDWTDLMVDFFMEITDQYDSKKQQQRDRVIFWDSIVVTKTYRSFQI